MNFKDFVEAARERGEWHEDGPLTGCRVKLRQLDVGDGPMPSETGLVITHDPEDDMIVIEVDEVFRERNDDGLRECYAPEWVEEVLTQK
jgi:hypothetical protein